MSVEAGSIGDRGRAARGPWWPAGLGPALVALCLGVGLTALAVRAAARAAGEEAADVRGDAFEAASAAFFLALDRQLGEGVESVFSVVALFESSDLVEEDEFATFTAGALRRHPNLSALEFTPLIRGPLSADGRHPAWSARSDRPMYEPGPDDTRNTPSPRPFHVPVLYVQPAGYEEYIGLDLGFEASRFQTFETALHHGRIAVSPMVRLLQGDQGLLVVVPIRPRVEDPEQGPTADGFALGVIRVDAALAAARADARRRHDAAPFLDVELRFEEPRGADTGLAAQASSADLRHEVLEIDGRSYLQAAALLSLGDRSLRATARSAVQDGPAYRDRTVLLAGGSGVALTLLLALWVAGLSSRNERVGREVLARTRDLAASHAELAEREAQLRAIFESAVDGLLICDADGRILSANPAARAILGASGRPIQGALLRDHLSRPPGVEPHSKVDPDSLAVWTENEVAVQGEEAAPLSVEVAQVPLSAASGVGLGLVLIRDIRERKVVDRLQRQFLAMVNHELRTPLTALLGALDLVRSGALGDLPPEVMRLVEIAATSGDRLVRIVNDMLDIEGQQAGRFRLQLAPMDLAEAVAEAVGANSAYAGGRGIHIEADLETGARIQGDRGRLIQVLTNLLSNAVKFSPQGGVVRVGLHRRDDRWVVGVRDPGEGVDPAFADRLFQPFARQDQSVARRVGGTGLGLAIARAIVDAHGGRIWFEPQDDGGAGFFFAIPAEADAEGGA
jgi:PAS domain S-box-containing protein